MDPLQAGDPETIGRYRLVGRLGEGGMGRVYLGRTPEGQQAAVKVIRDDLAGDTGFRHRFRREVSAAVSVAGIFTARVLDADPDADPPWLATQFVAGPSLREHVLRHGPLDDPSLHRLAMGLASALSNIHAAGLVHRDLKPGNVLLAADGARVIDFGIAHATGSTQLTGTGEMIGTPEYMSPEQVAGSGPPGPASDVFAMGATLCFAATGRSPFAASNPAAVLYRVLEGPADLTGVPPGPAAVVAACLAKDPARRPTAPQVAGWLRSGTGPNAVAPTGPLPVGPRPAPPMPDPPMPDPPMHGPPVRGGRGRRVALVAGAVVAVAAVSGAVAWAVTNGPDRTVATGSPVTTTAVQSTIDPNGREARYVGRLCAGGDLLVSLSQSGAQGSGDPTMARQEYLATVNRTIAVIDAGLADYTALRDEAPTPEIALAFQTIIDEFTSARASLVAGRDVVTASDPLTPEAYGSGVDSFGDATRNLAFAATLVQEIELPPEYTAASAVAPACQ